MTADNDMIRRGDALKARTLWMQIDGEGRIDSICTAPFPGHDAYISYRAIEAIPAVTTPDPRDEVIAALVGALDGIKNMKAVTSGSTNVQSIWDTVEMARAALAAAKAVQP